MMMKMIKTVMTMILIYDDHVDDDEDDHDDDEDDHDDDDRCTSFTATLTIRSTRLW